jgi:hypothetical protein
MVFWSLAVQSIKFVSWLNFSEMGGSIFPDCWFSQAVISTHVASIFNLCGKPAQLARNRCSIPAESVLNFAGLAAQFRWRMQVTPILKKNESESLL